MSVGSASTGRRQCIGRMLIPLDGSKTAEKVLPCARFIAGALKLPIELVAVVDIDSAIRF